MNKFTVAAFAVLSALLLHASYAQSYPSQHIQMILTLAPGDSGDLSGRAIGAELSKILKTPVVPVNKTGASGAIGADYVVKSKKDGYTILYTYSSIIYAYAANPVETSYDPFKDLEPLCLGASIPLVIAVRSESPWKSMQDLVDYARQNPGKLRGSSTGVGSVGHFAYEVIGTETGARIDMIPFKGAAPGMAALLGGHVEVAIPTPTGASPQVRSGRIRILLTSKKLPDYPTVPTLTELGYKRDISSVWFGFYLPAGVPDPVKQTLSVALEKSIKTPDVVRAHRDFGALEDYKPADEFGKMMREEYGMVKSLLKTAVPASK